MLNYVNYIKISVYFITIIFIFLSVKVAADAKISSIKEEMNLANAEMITAEQRKKELECLAINIYREAGYEPFEGKVAVAQVTMNRVESADFPNDVCGVVFEKNKFIGKVVCQFSWYCDSSHRMRPINPTAYEESMVVAKKVLLEGFRLPSLTPAIFYHADYVNPNWKYDRITKIGVHIFYKPKEKVENEHI